MKIAIVSDTHNNWANFKKIIGWLNSEKISLILHCGDIFSQEFISESEKEFKGEIKYVKGNADYGLDIPASGEVEFDGKKIAFAHFPREARALTRSGKYNIIFYGHTHRPWEEKAGSCRLVNPGEAAGQINKATFAVYDAKTDNLELKILEKLE